jgi:hypothetical protein
VLLLLLLLLLSLSIDLVSAVDQSFCSCRSVCHFLLSICLSLAAAAVDVAVDAIDPSAVDR